VQTRLAVKATEQSSLLLHCLVKDLGVLIFEFFSSFLLLFKDEIGPVVIYNMVGLQELIAFLMQL
jgi:hypothetical protein